MASSKKDSATHNMMCLLREWDWAPRDRRRQLLQDFIDQHWNKSGPEIELEMAQIASLFLARICVWIKLTYMTGTCLTEQLQVLYIFLSAASSHNFLMEFLQHGGVLCLHELCVFKNAKEIDKLWALKVLSCVANGGTRYKETLCECYGIRAAAECMAKSRSEDTQEAARNLLELLAEGNPRFSDQVYKGLIGVLPCNSPKAQQLALQSIRILQTKRNTANRALIDRIICVLESLHLEVQSAAIELIRNLMDTDIADDILAALVSLLRPQHEIQLGKLFADTVAVSDVSSDDDDCIPSNAGHTTARLHRVPSSDSRATSGIETVKSDIHSEENGEQVAKNVSFTITKFPKAGAKFTSKEVKPKLTKLTTSKLSIRTGKVSPTDKTISKSDKLNGQKKTPELPEIQPLPVFVQQASAAKCIKILMVECKEHVKKLLKLGVLSGLLHTMGNLEFTDSQRYASLALHYLCTTFQQISDCVSELMGPAFFGEFNTYPDSHYLRMTPLQADLLVSNKLKYDPEISI